MEKINIAKLLKDCPKGMELDSPVWDNIEFDRIEGNNIVIFRKHCGSRVHLTRFGGMSSLDGKCIIFPKGKTTWEGFQKLFKDGDVVTYSSNDKDAYIFIFKGYINIKENYAMCHMMMKPNGIIDFSEGVYYITRFATEEEKQKLFQAIKDNGYQWNAETKTLEKLPRFKVGDIIRTKKNAPVTLSNIIITKIKSSGYEGVIGDTTNKAYINLKYQDEYELINKPRFKVGDRVKSIYNNHQYDIKELTDTHYTLIEVEYKFKYTEPIIEDKNWELVPNKFDINTLKTFDRVLVRCSDNGYWQPQFFSKFNSKSNFPFQCTYNSWSQCIPYEGNEHLSDTTNDCDEFYKTWK